MYNKSKFDRTAFDRLSDGSTFYRFYGEGYFDFSLVILIPLDFDLIEGNGYLEPIQMRMRSDLGRIPLDGVGHFSETEIIMRLNLSVDMTGVGDLDPFVAVRAPISCSMESNSFFVNDKPYIVQQMESELRSKSDLDMRLVMVTALKAFDLSGWGTAWITNKFKLKLPIAIDLPGSGHLELERFSSLGAYIFELKGISIPPGGEIIIDSDLLSVWINGIEDVSSVTTKSVFFELHPGDNDIIFETSNPNDRMNLTAIWQNRWL